MSDIPLRITPPTLSPGYCMPGTVIGFVNDLFNGAYAWLPDDLAQVVIGSNVPSVDQRDRIWFKTSVTNLSICGIFRWAPTYGLWVQNHWLFNGCVPPTDKREIYVGAAGNVDTYDGGEVAAVTDVTGPFWEIDTDFDDCWPIGVGATIATVGNTANVFDVSTPAVPPAIGVYFLKPTGRIYERGS